MPVDHIYLEIKMSFPASDFSDHAFNTFIDGSSSSTKLYLLNYIPPQMESNSFTHSTGQEILFQSNKRFCYFNSFPIPYWNERKIWIDNSTVESERGSIGNSTVERALPGNVKALDSSPSCWRPRWSPMSGMNTPATALQSQSLHVSCKSSFIL